MGCALLLVTFQSRSQQAPQLQAKLEAEAASDPLIFTFIQDFTTIEKRERDTLEVMIAKIDSLDISASRKYKLVRDIYRNKDSKRLRKSLYTANRFEDYSSEAEQQ